MKHGRKVIIAAGLLIFVVMAAAAVIAAIAVEPNREAEEVKQPEIVIRQQEPETPEPQVTEPEETEEPATADENAFNTMSADWGGEDVAGWVFYDLPEDYSYYGSYLPEKVQVYLYCCCQQNGVDYATALAVIEVESSYKRDAISGYGAKGYMQIYPAAHEDRMERLGVSDIMDPYQNIRTGVDYLAELLEKYDGDYSMALTAYRWGPTGAYQKYFSCGQNDCEYSRTVLIASERIRKQLESKGGGGIE